MTGIDDRTTTVSKEMDTTELGEIYDLFLRYLTHSQIHNGKPQMVRMGRVYHAEGAYYFTTGGIREFLRTKKFSMGRINLHDQLQAYGCFEGELAYKTAKGTEKTVKCWKKLDDEELLEMDAFYDEVYDGDADTPRKSASDNDQEEGNGDEETKF
jgi:hypothetical protein